MSEQMNFVIEQAEKEQIEKIIEGIECRKDFECYKSGLSKLCKAKDIGIDSLLVCIDCDVNCDFSSMLGDYMVCKCPLRIYIAKNLKK